MLTLNMFLYCFRKPTLKIFSSFWSFWSILLSWELFVENIVIGHAWSLPCFLLVVIIAAAPIIVLGRQCLLKSWNSRCMSTPSGRSKLIAHEILCWAKKCFAKAFTSFTKVKRLISGPISSIFSSTRCIFENRWIYWDHLFLHVYTRFLHCYAQGIIIVKWSLGAAVLWLYPYLVLNLIVFRVWHRTFLLAFIFTLTELLQCISFTIDLISEFNCFLIGVLRSTLYSLPYLFHLIPTPNYFIISCTKVIKCPFLLFISQDNFYLDFNSKGKRTISYN